MKTYILGPVYNYYNFNILDIADTLNDIELFSLNKIINTIMNKYNICYNDCKKLFNQVII